jgi:hypothetical protein
MIVGRGRPSVNVEGHGTFSGSIVVVVEDVSSVDSEEVPLRRGMSRFCCHNNTVVKKITSRMIIPAIENLLSNASVILSDRKSRFSEVARLWLKIADDITRRISLYHT